MVTSDYHVAINNKDFKVANMCSLIDKGFCTVSVKNWENYVSHVIKIEDEMWNADEWQDNIDSFIISIRDVSSETIDEKSEDEM